MVSVLNPSQSIISLSNPIRFQITSDISIELSVRTSLFNQINPRLHECLRLLGVIFSVSFVFRIHRLCRVLCFVCHSLEKYKLPKILRNKYNDYMNVSRKRTCVGAHACECVSGWMCSKIKIKVLEIPTHTKKNLKDPVRYHTQKL